MKILLVIVMSVIITSCSNTNVSEKKVRENIGTEIESTEKLSSTTINEKTTKDMVMVNGKIYYNTNTEITMPRCGTLAGEIQSTVDSDVMPTKDNQANFSGGLGYQYIGDNTIDVHMDNKFIRFESRLYDDYVYEARKNIYSFFQYLEEEQYDRLQEISDGDIGTKDYLTNIFGNSKIQVIYPKYIEEQSKENQLVFLTDFEIRSKDTNEITFNDFYFIF